MDKTKVSDWMTRNPITIDSDASIIEAIHRMKERDVRRLPVMEKGRLAGLVTDRMLKEYSPGKASALDTWETHYLLSKTSVAEVMKVQPDTVTPDMALTEAAQLIRDHRLYGVCVVDGAGKLVGILTIKDLIEALFHLSAIVARREEPVGAT